MAFVTLYFVMGLSVICWWILDHGSWTDVESESQEKEGGSNIQQHQQQGRSDHSYTAAVVTDGVLLSTAMSSRQLLLVTALCARFVFALVNSALWTTC